MTRSRLVEHPAACEESPALIEHILARYHETHRRELPGLIALAQKVERVHGNDPNAPHGLAHALSVMADQLETHMLKEERVLFPAMTHGRAEAAAGPIAGMRHDHAEHEEALGRIAAITHGFRLPDDACRSWQALYAGTRKLVDDLDEHLFLEDEILFPRFEAEA